MNDDKPTSKRSRYRRDERDPDAPPIRLVERDLKILQAVYEYRVLTTQHLQTLFFPSLHRTYERLEALYDHGYLDRQFLSAYADKMHTPILYVLAKRGAELLRSAAGLEVEWRRESKQTTPLFLEHLIAINTVRVAMAKACADNPGFELLTWLGEAELKADYDRVTIRTDKGKLTNISLIPDSYCALHTPRGKAHFFLELDRGTMTTKRFKTKILAYQQYYASGAYEQRYHTKSLRVLTVTLSEARLNSLLKVTEEAGGKQRYWFTTLAQLAPTSVLTAPIWQIATQHSGSPLIALDGSSG